MLLFFQFFCFVFYFFVHLHYSSHEQSCNNTSVAKDVEFYQKQFFLRHCKEDCTTVELFPQEIESAILNAQLYLESRLNETLNDPYALALMTYALQLSGSSLADEALDALNAHAVTEGITRALCFMNFICETASESIRKLVKAYC